MSLEKPDWLRKFLSSDWLNFEFLGKEFFIGQAIERAIYFVLDWIDALVEWAIAVGAWWEDFRQEVIDAFDIIKTLILGEIQNILDLIESWWTNLGEWWEAKKLIIQDWIDAASDWLSDRIDDLKKGLDKLDVWWEDFTTEILPTLASKFDITKAFDDFMLEWSDLFEGWEAFKDGIVAFFTDPLDWLWAKFTDWFLGPEE